MEDKNKSNIEKLKEEYVLAIQNLQMTKKDKTLAEIADIERRSLFTKYMTCKTITNEDTAGALLQNELYKYTNLVDRSDGLNNYWKQFELLNIDTDNDPTEWKFELKDPNIALQFLESLPCNTKKTSCCKYAQYTDNDVEKLMNLWKKGGSSPVVRKIPQEEQKVIKKQIIEDKCKSFPNKYSSYEQPSTSKSNTFFKNEQPLMEKKQQYNERKVFIETKEQYNDKKPFIKKIEPYNERKFFIEKKEQYNERKPFIEKKEQYNERKGFIERKEQYNERKGFIEKKEQPNEKKVLSFKTAREMAQQSVNNKQPVKKSLGGRAVSSPFVCPFKDEQPKEEEKVPEPTDERLKNIEPKMIELIKNEIMDCGNPISWDDIAGLEHPKKIIKEIVVFPMLRPDIFTGLRRPPKGILLFGPPGTGKTLIGKCIASQSKSTFFSISASSLTSKWIGEGEKMVRALFAVAKIEQPSVIFIDEIDSLLCQRSETEHESSRRMKTEFLVQLDGATTGDEDRILVIGATNRPYELDEAARRRLVKRLYIPLPELEARVQIICNLLKTERNNLTKEEIYEIATSASGYSGADMTNLCKEASMGPIRNIPFTQLENINKDDVRGVTFNDFKEALDSIRPSVSQKDLSVYLEWNCTYGTTSTQSRI